MDNSYNSISSRIRKIDCPSNHPHKRSKCDNGFLKLSLSGKRPRDRIGTNCKAGREIERKTSVALLNLKQLVDDGGIRAVPLIYASTGRPCQSICLEPDRFYTMGRNPRCSQFVFDDSHVSRQHCQIIFDSSRCKVYILHGSFSFYDTGISCIVREFRRRLPPYIRSDRMGDEVQKETDVCSSSACFRPSLNGLFLNGVKIGNGMAMELSHGDVVMLVCGNKHNICHSTRIGFVIQNIIFQKAVVSGFDADHGISLYSGPEFLSLSSGKANKRIFAFKGNDCGVPRERCDSLIQRAGAYLTLCRCILQSDDPMQYICQCIAPHFQGNDSSNLRSESELPSSNPSNNLKCGHYSDMPLKSVLAVCKQQTIICDTSQLNQNIERICDSKIQVNSIGTLSEMVGLDPLRTREFGSVPTKKVTENINPEIAFINPVAKTAPHPHGISLDKCLKRRASQPGRNFYLNALENMKYRSSGKSTVVSLPELLYPVESISQMFIATFTSDVLWFLSYCEIPCDLPVVIACHNTEKCWSGDPEKRFSVPYPDFPNVVVVHPPFPEAIAFGKDRKNQGIACHHPKLFVLQRENSIRVIISSANLVEKQWKRVTNTIWWQDFPLATSPDYSSLFNQIHGSKNKNSKSDFVAHLAGFMASILIHVPTQAHWIVELTKYDFGGALAYLIASVPGIHSYRGSSSTEAMHFLPDEHQQSCSSGFKFLGSVEASVVGLSHLFHRADRSGAQIKKLAAFLSNSGKKAYGLSEIILRSRPVPADANAVAIFVADPKKFSEGDYVQLGFLTRNVAKWVSPLWDIGIFRFSGYVYCQQALAAALGGNDLKVKLFMSVLKGPNFEDISKIMKSEHVTAFCSLIASLQRCTGLWRLEQVLNQYKWSEYLESDFIYGASSIGSLINAKFLAAFSSASGKRSLQSCDSDESDPEWGRWNASQESKNPSIRIIFPTIERVKSGCSGILPSKTILCFSEKTWERLKSVDILHDAIPHPSERVGHPMHVKVARRRFESKEDASSSNGWVYCGSHNFSAAAWGQSISDTRLHVCNYELGVLFVFPPSQNDSSMIDDITMPFVVPPPKYGSEDRPATKRAMREALADEEAALAEEAMEELEDEEEERIEIIEEKEKEEENLYARVLWSQVEEE